VAQDELDREAALPLTADNALPETREVASAAILTVGALAMRTEFQETRLKPSSTKSAMIA
jgi:hypothetical protein